MSRAVQVTRVVDARKSQGRVIFWLSCGHTLSYGSHQADGAILALLVGGKVKCHHCPDLPPEEIHRSKTVRQLYREAGEP